MPDDVARMLKWQAQVLIRSAPPNLDLDSLVELVLQVQQQGGPWWKASISKLRLMSATAGKLAGCEACTLVCLGSNPGADATPQRRPG